MAPLKTEALRNALLGAVAVLSALALYTLLGRIGPSAVLLVNAFSVASILAGYLRGERAGAVIGTACGLLQDTFSLGVFGVAGLTKTLLGFLTGWVSRKVNLATPARLFLFFFLMAAGELALWIFFYVVISGEPIHLRHGVLFFQPPATALLAGVVAVLGRRLRRVAA